ncbi:restriction endonuclease subunit S [Bacteroides fragilis]
MKIKDIIDQFIAGDWGEETCSNEMPCAVTCVRGADIVPISEYDFSAIPIRYISQQSYSKKCLQVGDIIIEKSGGSPTQSTGRVSFVSQELLDSVGAVVCSNFCTAFRVKKDWNPLYVYYHLQFVYNLGVFFNFEGKTSGLKNLQLEAAFAAIPIEDISKNAQDNIVSILQGLDRKIAINRQINQNLEAMAKQLYDYWFVQFDFPNEKGKPYKSSGGEMVWNEKLKREIPIDWEVLPLFDAVSVQYGFPFATEQFTEEETNVPVVRIRDILEGTTSAYSLEKADEKYHLNENDVLVGMDGNFHMNFWHDNIAYLNQRCVRLRAHSDSTISSIQILHSIKPYIKAKEQNAKGSTVGHLSDKDLKGLYLIKPLKTRAFNPRKTLDGLLALVIENKKQILSLTKQRDELLPLLINGQITIE